jgi:hypothetical protein
MARQFAGGSFRSPAATPNTAWHFLYPIIRPQLEGVINRLASPIFLPSRRWVETCAPERPSFYLSNVPPGQHSSHLAPTLFANQQVCTLPIGTSLSLSHHIVHIKHYQLVTCSLPQIHHSVYPRMHTPYSEWTNGRFTTHATSIIPSLPVRLHLLISSQHHLYHHRHRLQHMPARSSSMYRRCWLDHT